MNTMKGEAIDIYTFQYGKEYHADRRFIPLSSTSSDPSSMEAHVSYQSWGVLGVGIARVSLPSNPLYRSRVPSPRNGCPSGKCFVASVYTSFLTNVENAALSSGPQVGHALYPLVCKPDMYPKPVRNTYASISEAPRHLSN